MKQFGGMLVIAVLLLIIIYIITNHHVVRAETKVKKFLLVGEDGQKVMLMKAIAEKMPTHATDHQIYRAKPLEWPHMKRQDGFLEAKKIDDVFVKIVHTIAKDSSKMKPLKQLTHEVDMLWLANANARQSVVHLFEAHIAKDTVYMVMELGGQTLEKSIEDFGKKWMEQQGEHNKSMLVTMDIHKTLIDMAKALADFHKVGIHIALKPPNWVYFNGRLKLIDLQTALAVDGNGKSIEMHKNIYICKDHTNINDKKTKRHDAVLQIYTSPEHKKFCRTVKKDMEKNDSKELTTAADIWSFGAVIIEILMATPQIRSLVSRKKWRSKWPTPYKSFKLYGIIVMTMMSSDDAGDWHDEGQKKEAKIVTEEFMGTVEKEFPHIYVMLINSIFLLNPSARATTGEIQEYLEKISKFHEKEVKWPVKEEAKSILEEILVGRINAVGSDEWKKSAKIMIEEEDEKEEQMGPLSSRGSH